MDECLILVSYMASQTWSSLSHVSVGCVPYTASCGASSEADSLMDGLWKILGIAGAVEIGLFRHSRRCSSPDHIWCVAITALAVAGTLACWFGPSFLTRRADGRISKVLPRKARFSATISHALACVLASFVAWSPQDRTSSASSL